jgi:hypothetical protein
LSITSLPKERAMELGAKPIKRHQIDFSLQDPPAALPPAAAAAAAAFPAAAAVLGVITANDFTPQTKLKEGDDCPLADNISDEMGI